MLHFHLLESLFSSLLNISSYATIENFVLHVFPILHIPSISKSDYLQTFIVYHILYFRRAFMDSLLKENKTFFAFLAV